MSGEKDEKLLATAADCLKKLSPITLQKLSEYLNAPVDNENTDAQTNGEKRENGIKAVGNFCKDLYETAAKTEICGLDFGCAFLENIWQADKLLQMLAFGPVGLADVLKRNGYGPTAKVVGDCGCMLLEQRAILRFWLFLYQWQKLRVTPRDRRIAKLAKECDGLEKSEKKIKLKTLLEYLRVQRRISKLQAYVNLIFQPLDTLGWISRASKGLMPDARTHLLDRGACTCWCLVESLELYATWVDYKYRLKICRLDNTKPDKDLHSKFKWSVAVRLLNMAMAFNWAKKEPFLSDAVIGLFGVSQAVIDTALACKS